jgi:sec-independent protein translocase protein TatC
MAKRTRGRLPENPDEVRMSIGEHLDDLRGCLIRSLIALFASCLACALPVKWWLLPWMMRPYILVAKKMKQPPSLLATAPVEGFVVYMKVVVVTGLVVASPYIASQIWNFVGAGLYPKERRWVRRLVWPSVLLFASGVVFMYVFALILSLKFLIGFNSALTVPDVYPTALEKRLLGIPSPGEPMGPASQPAVVPLLNIDPKEQPPGALWFNATDGVLKIVGADGVYTQQLHRQDETSLVTTHFKIADYLSFVLVLMIAFGLAFQMPLVVVFLVRSGIVPAATLRKYRRVVILIIVIIAGVLAPPDLLSHLMLSGPMILLFEIGLLVAGRDKGRKTEAASGDERP